MSEHSAEKDAGGLLYIYGASDDLIETEGALREEFNPPYGKPAFIHVKEKGWGTLCVLRVEFDPDGSGEWRITPEIGDGWVTIIEARHEDDGQYDEHGCPSYSDKAVVTWPGKGPLKVSCGVVR